MRRRSVSSFFSPGPRTPMRPAPPPAPPEPPPPLLPPRRDIDLQLSFAAARVSRKNIQNQLRAVDNAALGGGLNIPLLHRREIAIKDNQRRLVRGGFRANLVQLAAP